MTTNIYHRRPVPDPNSDVTPPEDRRISNNPWQAFDEDLERDIIKLKAHVRSQLEPYAKRAEDLGASMDTKYIGEALQDTIWDALDRSEIDSSY